MARNRWRENRESRRCSWTSPETCCGVCIFQTGALFFIWEAALCGWGVSEECFIQFMYEGHARVSETTSAWVMLVFGVVGLALSCTYWGLVMHRMRMHFRAARRARMRGSDAADEVRQREGLLRDPVSPSPIEVPRRTMRIRSPRGSPSGPARVGSPKLASIPEGIHIELDEFDEEVNHDEELPGSRHHVASTQPHRTRSSSPQVHLSGATSTGHAQTASLGIERGRPPGGADPLEVVVDPNLGVEEEEGSGVV